MALSNNDDFNILNLSEEEITKLQYDVLYTSTENNAYLTPSPITSLNKALKTENKRVILAINELLTQTKSALQATNEFKKRFNSVIGDEIADPSLLANLKEIDENFFKAVYKMYKDGSGGASEEIQAEIDKLNTDIDNLIEQINVHYSEESFNLNSSKENIVLENTPWSYKCIFVFINGIYYPLNNFNIVNNILTWLKDDQFKIDINDSIVVKYHYIDYVR